MASALTAFITWHTRLTIAGSCLPTISISVCFPFMKSIVFCFFAIDGVGLIAKLKSTGIPFVMPPLMPPLLLVEVLTFPSSMTKASFAEEPSILPSSKPLPNSMPLTAPIANIACESMPSTLSNIGSPTPAGKPTIAVCVIPPTLSRFAFASSIFAIICFPLSSFKTGNFSQSRLKTSFCISLNSLSRTFAHSRICVPIVTPSLLSASFKIAPVATIPAVTRPEKCPPPL